MGGCCCSCRRPQLHGAPIYYYGLFVVWPREFEIEKALQKFTRTWRRCHMLDMSDFGECPPASEERELLTSNDSATARLTTGLLFDMSVDTSVPDTFRAPPAPLPFDVVLGCARSATNYRNATSENTTSCGKINVSNIKDRDIKRQTDSVLASPKKFEADLSKSNVLITEEEDVCPTCLEDYDEENPRIIAKCNHHFHLSCILEWLERSDTCPICNQEMDFEAL